MKKKKYYIEARFKGHKDSDTWIVVGKTIKADDGWLEELFEGMLLHVKIYAILNLPENAIVDCIKIIEKFK